MWNNSFKIILIATTFLMIFAWPAVSQERKTEISTMERNSIVNKTYSFIKLFNKYHPCVEDAGHFSKSVSDQFKNLFSKKAILIQDLLDYHPLPRHGLLPEDYVRYLETTFPDGLIEATFSIETINPTLISDNFYKIEVKGNKTVKGYDRNGKYISKENYGFIIDIESDKEFANIKITGTRLPRLKPGSPLSPSDYFPLKIKCIGKSKYPVVGAMVYLLINNQIADSLISSVEGIVTFQNVGKGYHFRLLAETESLRCNTKSLKTEKYKDETLIITLFSKKSLFQVIKKNPRTPKAGRRK